MFPKENEINFLFVLFYLQSIILGSGFPQHGVSLSVQGWMWTWRAGWRGVGAEGVERSELVGETMREFVRMGAEAVREVGEGQGVTESRMLWLKSLATVCEEEKEEAGRKREEGTVPVVDGCSLPLRFPFRLQRNAKKIFFPIPEYYTSIITNHLISNICHAI